LIARLLGARYRELEGEGGHMWMLGDWPEFARILARAAATVAGLSPDPHKPDTQSPCRYWKLAPLQRGDHERDETTGRPIRGDRELIAELTDDELAEELLVAAMGRDHRRLDRFQALLAERDRRTEELLLVIVTGGTAFAAELVASALAARLRAALLRRRDLDALAATSDELPANEMLLQLADARLRSRVAVVVPGRFDGAAGETIRPLMRTHEQLRVVHVHCRTADEPDNVVPVLPAERIDVGSGDTDIVDLARDFLRWR
jgi:hypothetical protein